MSCDDSVKKIISDSQRLVRGDDVIVTPESKVSLPKIDIPTLSLSEAISKLKGSTGPSIQPFDRIILQINPHTEESDVKMVDSVPKDKLAALKDSLRSRFMKEREIALQKRREFHDEYVKLDYLEEEEDDEDFETSEEDTEDSDEPAGSDIALPSGSQIQEEVLETNPVDPTMLESSDESVETEDEEAKEDEDSDVVEFVERPGQRIFSDEGSDGVEFVKRPGIFSDEESRLSGRGFPRVSDFVEREAEISGSDSEDELEEGEDEYEGEMIDDGEVGDEELDKLARINSKIVAEDEEEALIRIKEHFLPDGEEEERVRVFSWRGKGWGGDIQISQSLRTRMLSSQRRRTRRTVDGEPPDLTGRC